MTSIDWQNFLRSHPIFSSLNDEEVAKLLGDAVAQERRYARGTAILKEGEAGDSIFLIRSGSVQVALRGASGPSTSLAVMHAGDIFGEMAVLERKPRSATVLAKEDCVLLELAGDPLRKLMEVYPEMQVKLYTIARDRMKQWFRSLGVGETN